MIVGTSAWDVIACVGTRAPGCVSIKSQASSAIIVSCTTRRNSNTRIIGRAPSLSCRAQALSGLTIMIGREGAKSGEVITGVGQSAPAGSCLEGQTVSTVIISGATTGNSNAGTSGSTPGKSSQANAFTSLTIMRKRAVSGNVITSVGQRTPGSSSFERSALTAAIIRSTTRWDCNTSVA